MAYFGCERSQFRGERRARISAFFLRLSTSKESKLDVARAQTASKQDDDSYSTVSTTSGESESYLEEFASITCSESEDLNAQELLALQFEETSTGPCCNTELMKAIAATFSSLVAVNGESHTTSVFDAAKAPAISIESYLARLRKYYDCSDACLVTCLVYVDRIVKLNPNFTICDRNIHALLAIAMLLSAKYNDDKYYSNAYYAKVCGFKLKALNALEREFVKQLNWKLNVGSEEYCEYRDRVLLASKGCANR